MKQKDNRFVFGVCKVSDKGQIVIPKEARDIFDIKTGDSLVMLGDKNKGLALVKAEAFNAFAEKIID